MCAAARPYCAGKREHQAREDQLPREPLDGTHKVYHIAARPRHTDLRPTLWALQRADTTVPLAGLWTLELSQPVEKTRFMRG